MSTQIKHIAEFPATEQEVLRKARTNFIQAKTAENLANEMKTAGKELADPVLASAGVDTVLFEDGYRVYRRPESRTTYSEKQLKEIMLAYNISPDKVLGILKDAASTAEFVKIYGQESRAGAEGK
jgi:hypothetical protein